MLVSQSEVELAEELMRKGRYPEAIERFRALLSVDPENAGVRARCGEAYRLSGNNERAFHHYNKASTIYLRNNDPSGALRMLQFANAVSPNEPEVLFRMAECLKALGEHQNMEPVLLQIVQVAKGTGDRRKLWALDELAIRYPDDMDICARRAESLAEAGRIDDAVAAWKKVSAWLDHRGVDFVPMLQRAAAIAPERADVGVDLANILLANRRARESLILLVPYYEKFPDDVGVLDTLLRALEALGATDKIIPARIELIKARAKRGMREGAMREIDILLQSAPDDIAALEVCAHACTAFNETARATNVWRKLAHVCDRLQKKFERDRAILMLLKANPDDEDALTLGARALREAARNEEAQVLENRLAMIRRLRARNAAPQPHKQGSKPSIAQVPSSPSNKNPMRGGSNPFGPTDGKHAKRRLGSGATVLADDAELEAYSARPRDLFTEEPTVPPDELQLGGLENEPSEPSLEPMPIAKNPYVDDLYLETGMSGAQTNVSRSSLSSPAIPQPSGSKAGHSSTAVTSTSTPSYQSPSYQPPPGAAAPRSISAPSVIREQWTSQPAAPSRIVSPLDYPTKPYPAQTPPPDVWASDDDISAARKDAFEDISGDSGSDLEFEDSIHTDESDSGIDIGTAYGELSAVDESELDLPEETPGSPEETTSRIAQLVSDELAQLRSDFQDETVRSSVLENMPVTREQQKVASPPPQEFDIESVRPTQRLPKLSDLFADLDRKKA